MLDLARLICASVTLAPMRGVRSVVVESLAGRNFVILGRGFRPQSGSVEDPSVVSRLTVVCALAACSNTSLAAKSIASLSWLVVSEAVLSGGGRGVGAGIA